MTDAALRTNARIREFDQKTVIGVSVSGGRAYTIRAQRAGDEQKIGWVIFVSFRFPRPSSFR
ncbi:hypothetical protein PVW47_05995 [Marinovum sp. SP66]|nr:hypothetical protein [Marinovum sp. SP66]